MWHIHQVRHHWPCPGGTAGRAPRGNGLHQARRQTAANGVHSGAERERADNDTCFAFATIITKSRSTLVITRYCNIVSVSTCVSKKKLTRHSDMSPSTHICTQLLLVHLLVQQAHKLHLIMEHGTLPCAYLEQWDMYVHMYRCRAILTFSQLAYRWGHFFNHLDSCREACIV